jgi:hypothetical protein
MLLTDRFHVITHTTFASLEVMGHHLHLTVYLSYPQNTRKLDLSLRLNRFDLGILVSARGCKNWPLVNPQAPKGAFCCPWLFITQ